MPKGKFQSSNVILISFAHLLHDVYSSFLAPLLPLLIEKLGLSYSMAGLLNVIQRLPFLLNPFLGLLADKMHMRYLVIFAPLITAIAASLMGAAPNFTLLAILVFVMGISAALFHVPSPVMIKKISGKYTGRGMSFYMFGGEIARTIGPIIILAAVSFWGLERTYNLIPFAALFTIFLFFKLRNIKISDEMKVEAQKMNVWASLRKYRSFLLMLSGLLMFQAIMKSAITAFLPTFLTNQGETVWFGGIALAVLELAGAAGTLFAGTISDRIGRKTTLVTASILSPIAFWFFIHAEGNWRFVLLILLGFVLFASGPVLLASVQDLKSGRPAFFNGIYMTISFFFGAIAVMFVGFLGDLEGLLFTYEITAGLALLSVPFAFLLFRNNKKT
jgi:FSR family fosmidomycin resistance protein-like MFS transporter